MKYPVAIASFVAALMAAQECNAHGSPIILNPVDGVLSVSGGLADDGYASQIFVEDDEDGDPFGTLTLPNVGPVILWQLPGLNISGMSDSSNLSIEVIAPPVKCSYPLDDRVLWYWNPTTEVVGPASADLHLLGTGQRFATLPHDDDTPPPPFLLSASMAGQQNFHNHGLLSYGLDNGPPAAAGAYGFFARLTSNQYAASDPFLVVLNRGVEHEQMISAAVAINNAVACDGDYNCDGVVDAADYVVWRKSTGTEDQYALWRENFGMTLTGAGQSMTALNVPEPERGIFLLFASSVGVTTTVRRWPRVARIHFSKTGILNVERFYGRSF